MTLLNSVEETFYKKKKKKDVKLNRAKDYYQDDKEKLRKQSRDKNRNFPEEAKTKIENMEERDTVICLKKRNKV